MDAGGETTQGGLFAEASPRAATPVGPLRLVRVVVERGIEAAFGKADAGRDDLGLTYRCDDPDLRVGERVTVPLGRGDKEAGGVVVAIGGAELAGNVPLARIKPVLSRSGAALPTGLLELAKWMAGYYVCPLGMVLACMLPAAVKRGIGKRTRVLLEPTGLAEDQASATAAALPPRTRAAWELVRSIPAQDWPLDPREVATRAGVRTVGPINKLIEASLLRGVKTTEIRARRTGLLGSVGGGDAKGLTLTEDQQKAFEGIHAALDKFGVHLLRGVTGSGKTEVYLRLIERVLARDPDAGAIVLVPEIALTPQTSERFRRRFEAAGVVTLHSGLSEAERHREWAAIAAGQARVVVGARSAIFAPMAKCGLIVVDEEHDTSYKQDQLPRYHARDVAIKRGHLEGVPVVLGSATPSLESWSNAQGQGAKYKLWTLASRPGAGELPKVEIVDLAEETKLDRAMIAGAMLGPKLTHAIGTTLKEGGQVILLHNRRGYASVVGCPDRSCGWVLQCQACSVAMVFHKDAALRKGGTVRCHHCLAEQIRPETCPHCGKRARSFGAGTQRLEEEIAAKFGALGLQEGETFQRVDSDTMRSAPDYFAALSRFSRGELRLLLGTQMIAKGLDFPNVRLVGVVNADTGLLMADFRASERTFQLVSQVAGRAGRADAKGKVMVQTYSPTADCLLRAAEHDYVGFARSELAIRQAAGLPPCARMARIVCRDKDAGKAEAAAVELTRTLREFAADGRVEVTGPMPCAIERIAEHWRFELKLVAPGAGELQRVLQGVRGMGLLKSDATTAVDVDPVSLM